jgi:hypothetical protein
MSAETKDPYRLDDRLYNFDSAGQATSLTLPEDNWGSVVCEHINASISSDVFVRVCVKHVIVSVLGLTIAMNHMHEKKQNTRDRLGLGNEE